MSRTQLNRSLNLCPAFATLRRRWIASGPDRTNRDFAEMLTARLGRTVTAQSCSVWATGSDASHASPPWDVVAALLRELGLAIKFDAAGGAALLPGNPA
jgi:hypothetical protein